MDFNLKEHSQNETSWIIIQCQLNYELKLFPDFHNKSKKKFQGVFSSAKI